MPNRPGHRRFGNVRRLPSGRYQVRYRGLDGRMRSHPETFARKGDAERVVSLLEAQLIAGEWTDPQRGRVSLGEYARIWIMQRTGLRPRTVDLYRWLLAKHIEPYLGKVPIGKISAQLVRAWRADLLSRGVSATMAAKAYRLLRAVLATAVEDDRILPRNPCRIRGAGSEHPAERPVLTVAQVFQLAELVGRRPVGNIRQLPGGGYRLRFQRDGVRRTVPEVYPTRAVADRALWRWPPMDGPMSVTTRVTASWCCWPPSPVCAGAKRPPCAAATWTWKLARCGFAPRSPSDLQARSSSGRPSPELAAGSSAFPARSSRPCASTCQSSSPPSPVRWSSPAPRAYRCAAGTSTGKRPGRTPCRRSTRKACISMISGTRGTHGRPGVAWDSET